MTSSVFDSFKVSINRMIATIIGAIVACFLQYIDFTNFWAIAIGIILIINICIGFNWKKSISLTCIVFIAIVLYEEADYVMRSEERRVGKESRCGWATGECKRKWSGRTG